MLKVCFVGLGSIAKRHIHNLKAICEEREMDVRIDAFRRMHSADDGGLIDHIYTTLDDVPDDYDVIFITNPTELHANTLWLFHERGRHFFIEKPITSVNTIEKLDGFKCRKESVYYVACPLRYCSTVKYLKDNLDVSSVNAVRCICSSYLPDWRKGTDYRSTYSANKDLGGGVSTDLIHEWDYLTYLFGFPDKVRVMMGKKSSLEINSEDCAIYIAEYTNMFAEVHLDYFGRVPIRKIEIFTDYDTIGCDILAGTIEYLGSGKRIEFEEDRNVFQKKELENFLQMISGGDSSEFSIDHAIKVLKLTQGMEKNEDTVYNMRSCRVKGN